MFQIVLVEHSHFSVLNFKFGIIFDNITLLLVIHSKITREPNFHILDLTEIWGNSDIFLDLKKI